MNSVQKQTIRSWCAHAVLALALPLVACGGSDDGSSPPKGPPPPPPLQATATIFVDGGLPYADFRFLGVRFDTSIVDITDSGGMRYYGPFGELGGSGSGNGIELALDVAWQPLYPNALYRVSIPTFHLKDGRTMEVVPPPPTRAPIREMVSAGRSHACTLRTSGRVYCWGANAEGQLGLGHDRAIGDQLGEMGQALVPIDLGRNAANEPVRAVQLSSGHHHNCALLETGAVKCWGANLSGQLGRGDALTRVGTQPAHMGNALPAVALGTGRTALFLAVGADRSCALLDNGQLKCWGDNAHGALGIGSVQPFIGHSPSELGDALPAVNLGSGGTHAVHVGVGQTHNCAVLITGNVKCWGSNSFGELGVGDLRDRGAQASDMGDALPKVELGFAAHAHRIAASVNGSCALLDGMARVKCWGRNNSGQLGVGDDINRGSVAGQMGDALPHVRLQPLNVARSMAMGTGSACAIEEDLPGRMSCWGSNQLGQLGIDSQQTRGSSADHMGEHTLIVKLPAGVRVTALAMSMSGGFACARLMDGRLYCWGNNEASVIKPFDVNDASIGDAPAEMEGLQPMDLASPSPLQASALHRPTTSAGATAAADSRGLDSFNLKDRKAEIKA